MNIKPRALPIATLSFCLFTLTGPMAHADEATVSPSPRWELTVGASAKHNGEGWKIAVPQTEIQYQWSERIELAAKASWDIIHPAGAPSKNGLGTGEVGLKWLLLEYPARGFSMALCPELARYISRSAVRRGIVSAQKEFAVAIETKFTAGMDFELKTGRNFVEGEPDAWVLALKATHQCLPHADCILTITRNFVPMEPPRMLVMPGMDWNLNRTLTLQAALGREVGPRNNDRKDLALRVGLKINY